MSINDWLPLVSAETRSWLIDHNGEALPDVVLRDIEQADGATAVDATWRGQPEAGEMFLSDQAVDWIETVANGEDDE